MSMLPSLQPRAKATHRTSRRTSARSRVLATAAAFAAVVGGLAAVSASAASAAPADTQVVSANPVNWTPKVLDGKVDAIQQVGNTVVVGGTFTQIQDATTGAPIQTRPYLFAYNATTGAILQSWDPQPNGAVDAIVPDAAGDGVYISGSFTQLGTAFSSRVAKVAIATGARDTTFKPPNISSEVYDLRLVGSRLLASGNFVTVGGVADVGMTALDPTTGARLSSYDIPDFSGTAWGTGVTTVRKIDVTPDGSKLVAIGNFSAVGGQARMQIAMLDLGASAATVSSWSSSAFPGATSTGASYCSKSFDTYMHDVSISPDGSFFVVVTTGAFKAGSMCDAASRWEVNASGVQATPTWVDYSGGDTFWAVDVTGPVTYVGGHMRWLNNAFGKDAAGPGAVPRTGIGAIDSRNGLPVSWNPGRARGVGLFDFAMTNSMLWAGSDTNLWAGETRPRLAGFPFAGGTTLPADRTATLPADVVLLGSPSNATSQVVRSFDGTKVTGTASSTNADDWSQARGAFMVDGTVYTGWADGTLRARSYNGTSFGASSTLNLFANGYTSDGTLNGQAYVLFGNELPRVTGMFFDRSTARLYYTLRPTASNTGGGFFYRAFTPESGVVGAQRFTALGGSAIGATASGSTTPSSLFLAGSTLYYADASGALRSIPFTSGTAGAAGGVTGSSSLVDSSQDWRSNAAFLSTAASGTGPNQNPKAAITASCSGLTCTFDASGSNDPDGTVSTYAFTFGDGTSAAASASSQVTHTYASAGTYSAKVTVTDNRGGTASASTSVSPKAVVSTIAFRTSSGYSGGATATHSFPVPAGVKAGDQMVMVVTGGLASTLTVPTGWTEAGNQLDTDVRSVVLTRTATASDAGSTVTLTWSAGTRTMVSFASYSGVGAVQVTGAVETSGTSISSHTTPGVTVGTAGSWVLSFWADKNASSTTWTAPAGQVVRAQPPVTVAAGTTRVSALLTDDGQAATTGPRAGLTATADGTANKATMFTLVLVPA